ncbi:hypothetical protein HDU80_011773 [Chytriomyces hyalinus]|nr:hypothetical protein HDU80_011773 [Chytriomyces hyalinus]
MDQFNDYLASEGFINHHNLMFQHSADLEASLLESFAEEVLDLTHDTSAPQDSSIMCFPPFNSSLSLPTFDDSHSAFFVEPFQQVVVGAGIPNDFQMPSSSFPFTHQPFQPLYHHHHQQTQHQQYQEQSLGFNSVSPSPSLESPYSSLHGYSSSTPPHTPTCLPLSIVAPSSTSMFYLDTHCVRSSPAPLESSTTTTTAAAATTVKITIPSTRSMHFSPLPTPVQKSPLSSFISTTTQLFAAEKRAASPFEESPCSESVEPASPSESLPEITLPSTTTTSTRKPKQSKSASTHSDSVYSPRKSSTTSKRSSTQQRSNATGITMGVKKRHILKERETKMLNEVFESTRFLQASQAAELAAKMGMTVTQIRIWFQNKRAFVKRQSSALSLQSDD